jgi:hypothetical protein
VEWHLSKVFGKLGISSRKELRPVLSDVGAAVDSVLAGPRLCLVVTKLAVAHLCFSSLPRGLLCRTQARLDRPRVPG